MFQSLVGNLPNLTVDESRAGNLVSVSVTCLDEGYPFAYSGTRTIGVSETPELVFSQIRHYIIRLMLNDAWNMSRLLINKK